MECWGRGGNQNEKEEKPQLPPGRPTVGPRSSLPCRTSLNPQGHRRSSCHPPPPRPHYKVPEARSADSGLESEQDPARVPGYETLLLIKGASLLPLVSPHVVP